MTGLLVDSLLALAVGFGFGCWINRKELKKRRRKK